MKDFDEYLLKVELVKKGINKCCDTAPVVQYDVKGNDALKYLAELTSDIRNNKHFEEVKDFENIVTGGSA